MAILPPKAPLTPTLAAYPGSNPVYTNITPLTIRDQATFLSELETLISWVRFTIGPHVDDSFKDIVEKWNAGMTEVVNGVNAALAFQTNMVNEALIDQTDEVNTALTQQQQNVQQIVNQLIADITNATVAISDPIILNVLKATVSQSRDWLDGRFLPQQYGVAAEGDTFIRPVGKGEHMLSPRDFGAKNNGVDDDTAALNRMFAWASTHRDRKWVVWLTGFFRITDTVTWDAYNTTVDGNFEIFGDLVDAQGKPDFSRYMVRAISTSPTGGIGSPVWQKASTWSGGVLKGNGACGLMDITGRTSSEKPAHVNFHRSTFTGGGIGINFGANVYMMTFLGVNVSLCRIGLYHGSDTVAYNSGERIEFIGSDITGHGCAVYDLSGQAFHMVSVSFSYVLRRIAELASTQMFMEACHFEFNAPYAPFFNLKQGGSYVGAMNSRWLVREASVSNNVMAFPANSSTGAWADNPRDRWGENDPVKIIGLTGASPLNETTVYYLRNVTRSSFQLSLTVDGPAISWTTAGSGSGLAAQGTAALSNLGHTSAFMTIRDGHMHGSDGLPQMTLSEGVGSNNFEIASTATFAASGLRLRTRKGGDLRDPNFTASAPATMMDDYVISANAEFSITNNVKDGINSLTMTKTAAAGTSSFVDLWIPTYGMSRFEWQFNYRSSVDVTVSHEGRFIGERKPAGTATAALGGTIWSSPLAAIAADWKPYYQGGRRDKRTPRWAKYVHVRWNLTNLAQGQTFTLDLPEISFL